MSYNNLPYVADLTIFKTSLTSLDLSFNKIIAVPEDTFINFPNLSSINLQHNMIPAVTIGTEMPSLTYLIVKSNQLIKMPKFLASSMLSLNTIDVSKNNIIDIVPDYIEPFPVVSKLYIEYNDFPDFPLVQFPATLTTISISYNNFSKTSLEAFTESNLISEISTSLLILRMKGMTNFHENYDAYVEFISKFTSLSDIILENLDMKNLDFLKYLSKTITRINLNNNLLESVPPEDLVEFTNLKQIAVQSNRYC